MSHKVHPFVFRLGVVTDWKSKWYSKNEYSNFLEQDIKLREFIMKTLKRAAVDKVVIERSPRAITISIFTARPGVVIGKSGAGVEDLKKKIEKILRKFYKNQKSMPSVRLEIQEIRNAEMYAQLVAQAVAEQLEKRIAFKRAMKVNIEKAMQNKTVQGVKIMVAGRLGGSEMARREWLSDGKIPLQTLRADIDFAYAQAHTTYGVIGVKVWIYRGEIFEKEVSKDKK